jgi:hypothetical protein
MSKETMAAVRKRRKALGLVQMNVWVREEDREAFVAATVPFRKAAQGMEHVTRKQTPEPVPRGYRLTFPITPPAAVRNAMKASGWRYDRTANVWTVAASTATDETRLNEVAALKIDHGAVIDFI